MISGNMENILSPIRTINGKVEVVDTSTEAQSGTAVKLEGCDVGAPLEVKLSGNVEDFTVIGTRPSRNLINDKGAVSPQTFTMPSGEVRTRYGFRIDVEPGTYAAHAETLNAISINAYMFLLNADGSVAQQISLIVSGVPYQSANATVAEGQYLSISVASSAYTQEQAEEFFYNGYNIQVEAGNLNTPYEPFGDIQVGAEVYQYGKNLFDYTKHAFSNNYWKNSDGKLTTSAGYSANYVLIPVEHLQGKTVTLNKSLSSAGVNAASGGTVFFEDNDTSTFISSAGIVSTFTVPLNAKYMGITIPRAYASGEEVQIEIGDTETDFEAYKEPKVFKSDANGVISGMTAYPVNTIVIGETFGYNITLTASYSIEVMGDTYTNRDKIKSIQLDRVGENKFFGFGICQKATIVLTDKDCECGVGKGDKLSVHFDDTRITPTLYITDVARDEVSNDLTLTTYDALEGAAARTFNELGLTSYTIGELAEACATLLKTVAVYPAIDAFNLSYEEGANFDGTETIRETLNAIAEATQTIYYISRNNELVFKRLDKDGAAALNIDKSQYISLENKSNVVLTDICSITELGDNLEAGTGSHGEAQNIYDNPLLELREDLPQLLQNAVNEVGGLDIHQYNLDWRGNYLLEIGDKIGITTKTDDSIYTYLLNDTINYNGGYKQVSKWEYEPQEKGSTNPTTLGEAIKQTYAKVDKANKQIQLVVSETATNSENISQIMLDTEDIMISVNGIQDTTTAAFDDINEELARLNEKASISVSKTEVEIMVEQGLSNGVESVDTGTGFTFNKDGLTISKSESEISTTITEDGMIIYKGDNPDENQVLTANNEGVKAIDLHATTYLIIGKNSRLEDYGTNKTACFWIGG